MIFVYFDQQGVVKELITSAIRTGDSGDSIYMYWTDANGSPVTIDALGLTARFTKPDGTFVDADPQPSTTLVGMELPDLPVRNLQYFNYDHTYTSGGTKHVGYQFYKIDIPTSVLEGVPQGQTLLIKCDINAIVSSISRALGLLVFTVENNGVRVDGSINESQYNYLLRLLTTGNSVRYVSSLSDISSFANDQIFLNVTDGKFYKKTSVSPYYVEQDLSYLKLSGGTLTGDVTITGSGNHSKKLTFKVNENDTYSASLDFLAGLLAVYVDDNLEYGFSSSAFWTYTNNDLGRSNNYWKDLYLTGSLKDGTNTVSIANIVDKGTAQNISGLKEFSTIPQTTAGRSYSNDRQLADVEYVDTEVGSVADDLDAETLARQQADIDLQNGIGGINAKIPSEASPSNQLADKDFVNSSIATSTATFRGTSATGLTEQQFLAWANSLTKDKNDYVFWNTTDASGNVVYKKYTYDGTQWLFEYALNNSSFTASQWSAINSGVSSTDVAQITTNKNNITTLDNEKLDITDAENDYQSKIVHKDITILTSEWSNNQYTTTFSNFVVGAGDSVLCTGSTLADESIIATYGVKLESITTTGTTTTAVFSCLTTPTESITTRLLLIKENVITSDSSVLTSASVDNTTIEYANSVLKVKDNVFNEKLVSGTNIKTVNGNSLLGSGNIVISGEPSAYLKNASVSGNTITITKKDDSTVEYSPESLPASPANDGDYVLNRNVSSGTSSDSWMENGCVVINAPTGDELTDEQYAALTSGKIVKVNGILGELTNPIIIPRTFASSLSGEYMHCIMIGNESTDTSSYVHNITFQYLIFNKNKRFYTQGDILTFTGTYFAFSKPITSNLSYIQRLGDLISINNKNIPSYPTTNTSPQCLSIGANGGNLSWASYSKLYKHSIAIAFVQISASTWFEGTIYVVNNSATPITTSILANNLKTFNGIIDATLWGDASKTTQNYNGTCSWRITGNTTLNIDILTGSVGSMIISGMGITDTVEEL